MAIIMSISMTKITMPMIFKFEFSRETLSAKSAIPPNPTAKNAIIVAIIPRSIFICLHVFACIINNIMAAANQIPLSKFAFKSIFIIRSKILNFRTKPTEKLH